MRRAAIIILLLLNLGGGVYRYSDPDPFHLGRLWDMTGVVRVVAACEPESFLSDSPSPACRSLLPYLPLAFPFFLAVAGLSSSGLEIGWILIAGGSLLLVFAREASAWAGRAANDRATSAPDSPRSGRTAFLVAFCSLVAFKGTSLGLLAGQPSLLVALLLYAFTILESRANLSQPTTFLAPARLAAAACLAVAASKPNIALPFFVYLLLRRDFALFALASAMTFAVQTAASFAWLGPIGSLKLLVHGADLVGSLPVNLAASMGASGRVDLEPLLAVFGLDGASRHAVLAVFAVAALAGLARLASRLDPRVLLFEINALFLVLLYHRDYDLVLLLLLAQPLLRDHRTHFGLAACAATLPAVLPLQSIHALGIDTLPQLAFVWNLLGTSMAPSVLGFALWLLVVDATHGPNARLPRATEPSRSPDGRSSFDPGRLRVRNRSLLREWAPRRFPDDESL